MERTQDKFCRFFTELGELCFQIGRVERPLHPFNFIRKEGQVINSDYFEEVKKKFPKAVLGFYMAIGKGYGSINCYLIENLSETFSVAVEFCNNQNEVEKTIHYATVKHLRENKIQLISYLTREWKPF